MRNHNKRKSEKQDAKNVERARVRETPLMIALKKIVEARDVIEAEHFAQKESGVGEKNWHRIGELADHSRTLSELILRITGVAQ